MNEQMKESYNKEASSFKQQEHELDDDTKKRCSSVDSTSSVDSSSSKKWSSSNGSDSPKKRSSSVDLINKESQSKEESNINTIKCNECDEWLTTKK